MIEIQSKSFSEIQKEYDHLFKTEPIRDEDRGYRWLAKQVLKNQPGGGRRLLDLACGGGYFLRIFVSLAPKETFLTGIDLSRQAIRLARKECPQAHYLIGVGEKLPFQPESFDNITCWGSLEHFLNISRAIDEMKRAGTADATFFILVPNLFWYKDILSVFRTGHRKDRNQTHERFASLGEWASLLESFGLHIVRVQKYNGIAKYSWKQWLKDLLIPLRFSYHFLFVCRAKKTEGKIYG